MKNISDKGVCDPHIYIYQDKAYLYATHDFSIENKTFTTYDWWIWSSDDLVNWTQECVLRPQDTYIGKSLDRCWATDSVSKNGKYYWTFSDMSDHSSQIGLVESDTPKGPWRDFLGHPLVPRKKDQEIYDPAFYKEGHDVYLIFGVWDYYIAKMKEDMSGLAEPPRKILIHNVEGPYGKGSADDKPYLHFHGGYYYLSWGCYYAMSRNVYGPYTYTGCLISEENLDEPFRKATWPHGFTQGRHGNFFEWHNQWYYTYCDMSRSGNRYFRDFWISYIHYKKDGTMAPVKMEECGVGQYYADRGPIQAVNYFAAEGTEKVEIGEEGFAIHGVSENAYLRYPNILRCPRHSRAVFRFVSDCPENMEFLIDVETDGCTHGFCCKVAAGSRLAELPIPVGKGNQIENLTIYLPQKLNVPLLRSVEITDCR